MTGSVNQNMMCMNRTDVIQLWHISENDLLNNV